VTDPIRFEVRGLPAPEGNLRAGRGGARVRLYHQNSRSLNDWRQAVASAVQAHAPPALWTGPVAVELEFSLPQPKSVPTHRGRGKKRAPVRSWPVSRPDLDKFVRAVLDALTLVVWVDDSQVVSIRASKEYGVPGLRAALSRVQDGPTGPDPSNPPAPISGPDDGRSAAR